MTDEEWMIETPRGILGPFSPQEIRRFVTNRRIGGDCLVSEDGELWEPLSQVPQLVPVEVVGYDYRAQATEGRA